MADEKKGMKTAYELALERLRVTAGDVPILTEEQKRRIAEIDRETEAKIAEQEILLKARIVNALGSGKPEDAAKLRDELVEELRRIRERGEEKKEEVRLGKSGTSA